MPQTGILGGTFDPPHYGHLALARAAKSALQLDRILFVPAGIPPHKTKQIMAAAVDRVAMLRLLIADNPEFEISEIELERPGPSYTVETLAVLARMYPTEQLFLLIGADNVVEMEGWYQPERILSLTSVAAANRPGYVASGKFARDILYFDMSDTDISSTTIRARVEAGETITAMAPPAIVEYIARHGLYLDNG